MKSKREKGKDTRGGSVLTRSLGGETGTQERDDRSTSDTCRKLSKNNIYEKNVGKIMLPGVKASHSSCVHGVEQVQEMQV